MIGRVEELAAEADDVASSRTATGAEYRRGHHAFAAVDGRAVELRLPPEIAEAARRTPDTGASSRGAAWVRFEPSAWDDHDRDRLEAWFRVAWRLAGDR